MDHSQYRLQPVMVTATHPTLTVTVSPELNGRVIQCSHLGVEVGRTTLLVADGELEPYSPGVCKPHPFPHSPLHCRKCQVLKLAKVVQLIKYAFLCAEAVRQTLMGEFQSMSLYCVSYCAVPNRTETNCARTLCLHYFFVAASQCDNYSCCRHYICLEFP